jgi:hypothetical protein
MMCVKAIRHGKVTQRETTVSDLHKGSTMSGWRTAALAESAAREGLPRPLSRLIGRESELAAIQARLESSSVRLLTLMGPGGVGKSRLALEVGRRMAGRYPGGARSSL